MAVRAAGVDIWGQSDQFQFVYRQLAGDGAVVMRVASITNVDPWAKAGLMMRESLAPNSRHALVLTSPGKGTAFQRRLSTGGVSTNTSGGVVSGPVWLKLQRSGSSIDAYRSIDGSNWTLVGRDRLAFPGTIYVGVAVTSHDATAATTAQVTDVMVQSGVPSPWASMDIGSPSVPGAVAYANGRFTIGSTSRDIWGTSDQFRFTYLPMSGDVDIVARVASLTAADAWSKAGVMIRASLAADSAHASLFASVAKGVAFQRRLTDDALSVHTTGSATATAPTWVKLERRGDTITAFRSVDGALWTAIASEVLPLPSTFYVGLAVTSHTTLKATTAVLDSVDVRNVEATNAAPTVQLTSPTAGATTMLGSAVALTAAASDADGSVSAVQFYAGGELLGTATGAPYTIAWVPPAAGTYTVTAVATDDRGAATTSRAAVLSVAAKPTVQTLRFTPSPDHATGVNYYYVRLFAAGADVATAAPMATMDLGKPAIVGGDCAADITSLVAGLPAGNFVAVVTAVGPTGESASPVSPIFAR